jgi:hypothetical protein
VEGVQAVAGVEAVEGVSALCGASEQRIARRFRQGEERSVLVGG